MIRTGFVPGSLTGAPAVHFNFTLMSFYLYTTFKTGIAAAWILFMWDRGGFVNADNTLTYEPYATIKTSSYNLS